MTGGAGNDTYFVDHAGDLVVEATGGGTDTVKSSIAYALPANVEKLVLTGSASIDGTGNGLANTLTGNSGVNVLAGGAGNDVYDVQNAADVIVERPGEGTDTAQSSVGYVLPEQVENLTLTGSAPINGTGNALANPITGNAAANVLDGGRGDDTLAGGRGGDTYLFAPGMGRDTIVESDATANVVDTARFGGGLRPLDLILSQRAYDLVVEIYGGAGGNGSAVAADAVTVRDWFRGAAYQVETIEAGGQRLLASQVAQIVQAMAQWSATSGLSWSQGVAQDPAEVQAVLSAHWQPA
jgi:Ca2+-binding RTX toxin-like protein